MDTKWIPILLSPVLFLFGCEEDRTVDIETNEGVTFEYETRLITPSLKDTVLTEEVRGKCFTSKTVIHEGSHGFAFFNYCDTVWSYRFNDSVEHSYYRKYSSFIERWRGSVARASEIKNGKIDITVSVPEMPTYGVSCKLELLRLLPTGDSVSVGYSEFDTKETILSIPVNPADVDSLLFVFGYEQSNLELQLPTLTSKYIFVEPTGNKIVEPRP